MTDAIRNIMHYSYESQIIQLPTELFLNFQKLYYTLSGLLPYTLRRVRAVRVKE